MKVLFLIFLVFLGVDVQAEKCQMSEEYQNYLKLSSEEKMSVSAPSYCRQNYDNSIYTNRTYASYYNSVEPKPTDAFYQSITSRIRDQQNSGICWAFAATSTLEIFLKKTYNRDFLLSPLHMFYTTSNNYLTLNNGYAYSRTSTGGNYNHAASYLISNYGPVLETDMPFNNNLVTQYPETLASKKPVVDVNEIKIVNSFVKQPCTANQINEIKSAVLNYGAVTANVFFDNKYYEEKTGAIYYNEKGESNHEVVIVGWDDNYDRAQFNSSVQPTNNGAFIIQNSYGNTFGKNGLNYVSYDDNIICSQGFMAIVDTDFAISDNEYNYNKLSPTTNYKVHVKKEAYAMNIFRKKSSLETLSKITFFATDIGTYELYLYDGDASNTQISNMTKIGEGTIDHTGYISHKFDKSTYQLTNSHFSIVVYFKYKNHEYPISYVTYEDGNKFYQHLKNYKINLGQGYVSSDGKTWKDLAKELNSYAAIAIQAYTDTSSLEISDYQLRKENNTVIADLAIKSKAIDYNKLKISMTPTKEFTAQLSEKYLTLRFKNNLEDGNYHLEFKYFDKIVDTFDITIVNQITSSIYKIDQELKTITIKDNITKEEFEKNTNPNKLGIIYNNSYLVSGIIGTNMIIGDYKIIVPGDVTGDGQIKMNDVMKISKYLVGDSELNDFKIAADVTGDGEIRMNDVMKISKYLVEGGNL